MSCSNPRRSPVTRLGTDSDKASTLKSNMTLRKGATFHSPASPSSSFVPPRLTRSQTHMDDVVDANRRRMAMRLDDIDQVFSKPEKSSTSKACRSPALLDDSLPVPRSFLDDSFPAPRSFFDLPVADPAMAKQQPERRILRPRSVRRNKHQHASDSGLGSSIASLEDKSASVSTTKTQSSAFAVTRTAITSAADALPSLSQKAIHRIIEHVVRPLLEDSNLKDFHPIVNDVPRRIREKEIICLRDLEKTLLLPAPEKSKTADLYIDFGRSTVRCIQATVEYISEHEQIRVNDKPYTNGYFIDLVQQIEQYGKQLAAAKDKVGAVGAGDVDVADEVKLYGGIAENGRPAELIRVKKDGTAISMATGEPVNLEEGSIKIKRSLSEQLEDEEEIMRSMARRKKNAPPEDLAPKKCREPGCTKEFKRPCDLTKHEKTHSRPWKCKFPTCKYHKLGWPTEKEMDRHVNDKHSDSPAYYECHFKPCVYKSKRESNCKQHMEKTHGWTYVRTKTNGKKASGSVTSPAQQTPALEALSTPSETPAYMKNFPPTPQEDGITLIGSDFPAYLSDHDWCLANGVGQASPLDMDMTLDSTSPSSAMSYEVPNLDPYQNGAAFVSEDELYAATVQIPMQPHFHAAEQFFSKMMPQQPQIYQAPVQYTQPQVAVQPQFSPNGQQNLMLFTPNSLRDVDEGFDDSFGGNGPDFALFPADMNTKGQDPPALFGEIPSAGVGFSQTSQQDFFPQLDWSNNEHMDLTGFQE
jgi:hypothetical protein